MVCSQDGIDGGSAGKAVASCGILEANPCMLGRLPQAGALAMIQAGTLPGGAELPRQSCSRIEQRPWGARAGVAGQEGVEGPWERCSLRGSKPMWLWLWPLAGTQPLVNVW